MQSYVLSANNNADNNNQNVINYNNKIIIIIIIIISFMQGIYIYIPETNYVPREYSVAAILLLLFMVFISLVSVLNLLYFYISTFRSGDRDSTVVKVLCYKSEGRWFDPSWCHCNFSDRTMALGSTQPLTEMSTRSISWG